MEQIQTLIKNNSIGIKKRFDYYITDRDKECLKELSNEIGATESEIIRWFIRSNYLLLKTFLNTARKNYKNDGG